MDRYGRIFVIVLDSLGMAHCRMQISSAMWGQIPSGIF